MYKYLFLTTYIITTLISCTEISEPKFEPKQVQNPYITFAIGDTRQYYSTEERMFFGNKVIDTVRRKDGLLVYVMEHYFYSVLGTYMAINYNFIRDGYFWTTELDTIQDSTLNKINPFNEMKIIAVYPKDGEIFLANEGVPEDEKEYRKINLLKTYSTPIKTYQNVEECEIISPDTTLKIYLYYVQSYGHIVTRFVGNGFDYQVYATYFKVGNYEFGDYIPFDEKALNKNKLKELNKFFRGFCFSY
jgi:hypothetical protein